MARTWLCFYVILEISIKCFHSLNFLLLMAEFLLWINNRIMPLADVLALVLHFKLRDSQMLFSPHLRGGMNFLYISNIYLTIL